LQGHEVYKVGQKNHIIAIFFGTFLKSYSGSTPFLSGTSACRWYINVAEIPEITTFYTRYKICLTVTDGTCELQFMLFNERAAALLGKPAEKLVKQYGRFDTPPEIRALVGEKMTVVVKVMPPKSAAKSNEDPTFDILNIKKRHGKDFIDSAFQKEEDQTVLTTTSSYPVNLAPLVPIQFQKEEDQV
ncbi:hypothetical protein BAE44_0020955, partial [Dichanthelium oligosanthes]